MIDRSPVQIAVSTGGASPGAGAPVTVTAGGFISAPAYGRLAELVDDYRERVKQRFTVPDQRRYFWENTAGTCCRVAVCLGHGRKRRVLH